jgi:hypothetical protein
MDLEEQLKEHLARTGEGLTPPPSSAASAISTSRKRRRVRRTAASSLAAIALVAGGIGAYQLSDRGAAQDIVNDPATDVAAATSDSSSAAVSGVGADSAVLPVGTGPTLDWQELAETPGTFGSQISWTGSAFIALNYAENGSTLASSTDGRDWTPLASLPADINFHGMQNSGESIVIWGYADDFEFAEAPPSQIFSSSDGGSSWTDLGAIEFSPDSFDSPYLKSYSDVGSAAINGTTVVVAVMNHVEIDIDRVLSDNGIDVDVDQGYGLEYGEQGEEVSISICIDAECNDEVTYSGEELGLGDAETQALMGESSTQVHRSVDGGAFVSVDVPDLSGGFTDAILAVDGQFVMCVTGEGGGSLYHSADGSSWTVGSTMSEDQMVGMLTTDGSALFAQRWGNDGTEFLRSDDLGRTWQPMGINHNGVNQLIAGSAGVMASGQLYDESYDQGDFESFPVSIDKDGYRVTWAETSINVVDLATGDVVLEFGEEAMEADEAPETVIENETEGDFGLTFLHPETLEPLVTLTDDDMAEAFGYDEESIDTEDWVEPENFFGWSADSGQTWGWQTSTEAFGANGWAEFVVGDDVVLAIFRGTPDHSEAIEVGPDGEPMGSKNVTVEGDWTEFQPQVFVANLG